ncbi:MAG TPA: NAD-dependent epimerase [Chloroflexi bacterium]|nr:NAD-dependent epimerase [Chloroflexota bacterium]
MKVAVTGASGFVGGAIQLGLRQAGHEVIGISRRGPDISWDIRCGPLSAAPTVDAVVHCAALVRDGPIGPEHIAVNVDGTRNVLSSFPGARFVHISSASVYDPWVAKTCVREDVTPPERWLNGYGQTKWMSEVLVRRLRPDAAILRPHAVYGSGDATLLPRLLRARLLGRQLAIGDGRNRITLTSISNLVDAVSATLCHELVGPFNIGDADTPTVAEVFEHLLHSLGMPAGIVWIPRSQAWAAALVCERLSGPREPWLSRYVVNQMSLDFTLSLERARQELHWEPKETYKTGFAALTVGA